MEGWGCRTSCFVRGPAYAAVINRRFRGDTHLCQIEKSHKDIGISDFLSEPGPFTVTLQFVRCDAMSRPIARLNRGTGTKSGQKDEVDRTGTCRRHLCTGRAHPPLQGDRPWIPRLTAPSSRCGAPAVPQGIAVTRHAGAVRESQRHKSVFKRFRHRVLLVGLKGVFSALPKEFGLECALVDRHDR